MLPAAQRLTLKDFPYAMAQTAEETARRSLRARQHFLTVFFSQRSHILGLFHQIWGSSCLFCVCKFWFTLFLNTLITDSCNKCVVYVIGLTVNKMCRSHNLNLALVFWFSFPSYTSLYHLIKRQSTWNIPITAWARRVIVKHVWNMWRKETPANRLKHGELCQALQRQPCPEPMRRRGVSAGLLERDVTAHLSGEYSWQHMLCLSAFQLNPHLNKSGAAALWWSSTERIHRHRQPTLGLPHTVQERGLSNCPFPV